jgi:hypothetical protein
MEAEQKLDEETEKILENTDIIEKDSLKKEVDKAKETLKKLFNKKGG